MCFVRPETEWFAAQMLMYQWNGKRRRLPDQSDILLSCNNCTTCTLIRRRRRREGETRGTKRRACSRSDDGGGKTESETITISWLVTRIHKTIYPCERKTAPGKSFKKIKFHDVEMDFQIVTAFALFPIRACDENYLRLCSDRVRGRAHATNKLITE